MAIPDFQTLMRPMLEFAADGKPHTMAETREALAAKFKLTEQERALLLPSGRQGVFLNRVAWARVYLQHAGLLDSPARGSLKISDLGRSALADIPERITISYLMKFPSFAEFRAPSRKQKLQSSEAVTDDESQTPEEILESAHSRLFAELAADVLTRVKECSPGFFENLVVELLLKMGYGGSREEAGKAVGASGDEGIDGVINEDRLGLDTIYLQAKRWANTVGRPDLQQFVGALHGKKASKGVFITTSKFSNEGRSYVASIEPKVILIDGELLAQLMVKFNVGVEPIVAYEVKKIDVDYFEER